MLPSNTCRIGDTSITRMISGCKAAFRRATRKHFLEAESPIGLPVINKRAIDEGNYQIARRTSYVASTADTKYISKWRKGRQCR